MKYIFDFDDVLFHTSLKFKKKISTTLEKAGINTAMAHEYLQKERLNRFSLKKMLAHFSLDDGLHEEIMDHNHDFTNEVLVEQIKSLGKENCYILTYGDEEFQRDKIKSAGIEDLFCEIIVTPDSKKEALERICATHKNEDIFYIDDEARHFVGLDFTKCPNLKTILYTGQELDFTNTSR